MARHVLRFVGIALALLAARFVWSAWLSPAKPSLVVAVSADGSSAERAQRVRDAVLLETAILHGLHRSDPVVTGRLALNVLFARGEDVSIDALPERRRALADEAIAMGMHRSDAVARRRLIDRVEHALMRDFEHEAPDATELSAYFSAHSTRYQRPLRVRYEDFFFANGRRGKGAAREAAAELVRAMNAMASGTKDEAAVDDSGAKGDPTVVINQKKPVTAAELNRRLGAGFGDSVAACTVDAWCGPIASAYGFHAVRVLERQPAERPSLADIRSRVIDDWRQDRREAELAERVDALRRGFDIQIVERPGDDE